MKVKFLKKEIIFVILSLLFSNILVGCSINTPPTDSDNKKNSSILQDEEKKISKDSSKEVNPTEKLGEDENYKNNLSPETAKVSGKVKLYEGTYFDDSCFGDNILKTFYEVVISNVTDTSFDFTVYQSDAETGDKEGIFLTNTAVFTVYGTEASFYGNNYTLHFTFPDYHGAYPVATDMEIYGFEPLEGKTYVNNGIPGHEFG
ncbi:hypothetical protein [Clostridium ganghwense]|uniref:Lipoprotein n=1 Tax=Clostridium ganghwense TaxID=312089 RepID=A0ABT4CU81_9CLOT|nr:hypothetical protein [Clostridium ganghwense]MCY6372625.1 hypothetical protein [Clostridium ganghwense]